jgi:hypothetical protein
MTEPEWEYFVRDSFGHELIYRSCEYCMVSRPVQLWSIAEEDSNNIASITLSYPFQIKQLMREVDIHGNSKRKCWVCLDCLSEIEEQKQKY